jgi:hypothetical protein
MPEERTIEQQLQQLNTLIIEAQAVLVRFPFQTNIRQNISTLKDRRRDLKKELQLQVPVAYCCNVV